MSDRVLWFLIGAGAVYLFAQGGSAGARGGLSFSIGGGAGAASPPDQKWARATPYTQREGVWDPMGNPTWYQDVKEGSSGNKVMSGGGYN